MKKLWPLSLTFVVLSCFNFEGGTYKPMQDDFDKIRLQHMIKIYKMAEGYKNSTGKYPFQDDSEDNPLAVIFETERQAKYHKGNYPIFVDYQSRKSAMENKKEPDRVNYKSAIDFYKLITQISGKNQMYLFDPQKVPVKKPCVYIYVVYAGIIDVSVFLHNELSGTRNVTPFNNKISLTSADSSYEESAIWRFEDFKKNNKIQSFINDPLNKPGYKQKLEFEVN